MRISQHENDWCHICGVRAEKLADVWYSKNAENDPGDESQYIRICSDCCIEMTEVRGRLTKTVVQSVTNPLTEMSLTDARKLAGDDIEIGDFLQLPEGH